MYAVFPMQLPYARQNVPESRRYLTDASIASGGFRSRSGALYITDMHTENATQMTRVLIP